ncbi:DUF5658 family protein [Thermodesulfobacteriota bacterium]
MLATESDPKPWTRADGDRRKRPTMPISPYSFRGRRHMVRRDEDKNEHIYVDRYGAKLLALLLFILVLCVADAYLTIINLNLGAEEMNPFMDILIKSSSHQFFWVKYILTALSLILLCVYKNKSLVRRVLVMLSALYVLIILNHFFIYYSLS